MSGLVLEGPLSKWTNMVKGWQYRWFVLDTSAGILSYYTSKEKMIKGDRRGCVRLKGAVIGIEEEDKTTFTITVDGKTFRFQAHNSEERSKWVSSLEETILRHTYTRRKLRKLHSLAQQNLPSRIHKLPTLGDYERKLTETDSYLQLLIGQTRALDEKISSAPEESEKEKLVDIKAKILTLLDSVKHTIFLLQIAKNSSFSPDNTSNNATLGSRVGGTDSLSYSSATSSRPLSEPHLERSLDGRGEGDTEVDKTDRRQTVSGPTSIESRQRNKSADSADGNVFTSLRTTQPREQRTRSTDSPTQTLTAGGLVPQTKRSSITLPTTVPEVSYSSDDDEDFYDAIEESPGNLMASSPSVENTFVSVNSSQEIPSNNSTLDPLDFDSSHERDPQTGNAHSARTSMESDLTDYDMMYDSDEDELGSMEAHGSVISHLLSQVKIGMDLTKVVLPTFILERRSLLEMYADFFAHPDLFISIPDFDTPELRMIQVLRWYLSAFHAGRKSTVAKKPYNPILGEQFKCHWEVPNYDKSNANPATGGPIPWATSSDLSFVSEQVSHHPPVSAFYAEHVEKRIQCVTYIYTKSKFLGLSVGVHNIGNGTIYLLDHNEEYVITFPSAYGRSILSVPWIELGGSCSINCPQSGYAAQIEFHTKPFYGGKKNRITAELVNSRTKKPVMSVSGEWNGVMHSKWPHSSHTEVFIDTKTMPIVKKLVKPIREQETFESRRIWKDVTRALKHQDVSRATQEKYAVEQKQRELVKSRHEQSLKWQNRLFHPVGEKWSYNTPLSIRDPK